MRTRSGLVAMLILALCCVSFAQLSCEENEGFSKKPVNALMNSIMPIKLAEINACKAAGLCPTVLKASGPVACDSNGMAGDYPCKHTDLLSFVPLSELGSVGNANDIWGWTDPLTRREYAIVCLEDGTSFVDVTAPEAPLVLGFLPTHTASSTWRDAKVYKNHAFIVSEAKDHGMQVFDLTLLRGMLPSVGNQVTILEETAFYGDVGSTHNIVINEESGFAYLVGTKTCDGGLHIVNIQHPNAPVCAGCFWQDGYTHDAQCVNYQGPDQDYTGKEICFCYNEDTLTIVDVTNKMDMIEISRRSYNGSQYTHQGWLTNDAKYLFLNDELDEVSGTTGGPNKGQNQRTLIWDVEDIDNPVWVNTFMSELTVIDHNLYVNGTFVFESNYCGGLRVLRFGEHDTRKPTLKEVAYFDVAPSCSEPVFFGSWSNYPYFASGTVVVTSIERGLFVVKPHLYLEQ